MNYKFAEIFKKSFIQGWVQTDVGAYATLFNLLFVLGLALVIFLVYRTVTRKTFYSKNFGISLICISLITTAIIMAIQSNIVISLGMVGALSIVRFRTAIKDPMDLVFLFWSISIGIICGAHLYKVAFVTTVFLSIVVLVLGFIPVVRAPQILTVNAYNKISESVIMDVVKKYAKYSNVKSRNLTTSHLNLTIECRTDEGEMMIEELSKFANVISVNLLAHDGDVVG